MLTDTVTDRDVYFNAEYKSYQAVQDVDAVSGVETYKLVETEESNDHQILVNSGLCEETKDQGRIHVSKAFLS